MVQCRRATYITPSVVTGPEGRLGNYAVLQLVTNLPSIRCRRFLDRELHNAWQAKQTIYIVNRDGTGFRQLVDEAGPQAVDPVLSPNGAEVLYTQEINGQLQIFKLDVNSGLRTQLTHVGGIFRQANSGGDWFDPAYAYALPVSPQPDLLTTTWGEMKKEK